MVTKTTYHIVPQLGKNFEVWDLTVKPIRKAPAEAIIDWPQMGGEDGDFYSIEALEELGAGSYLPHN
jgi:hypothetical protein